MIFLFKGQIDGQEITASAVLTQRVRPPPRRLSPPRRMPPPPPMWRRSPPRMRRRYVEWFSISNYVYLQFDFYTTAVYCVNVFCLKLPSLLIFFAFPPQELFKKKKVCIPAGPAPQGGDPQHAAALAPDLLVAGVTALVPAPTPPDRWVPCLLRPCVLLDSLSDQLEFLIPRPPGLNTNKIICIVANTNMCLHVESGSLFFFFLCKCEFLFIFCVKLILKHWFCVYVVSSWVGAPLRSTDVSFKVWLLFNLYWIFRHFQK